VIRRTLAAAGLVLSAVAVPAGSSAAADAPATAVAPVAPAADGATHFVDQAAKLAGFNDPQWYQANIPFLDVPDKQIEAVYYYRWRTWKEHLRYTDPADGWFDPAWYSCVLVDDRFTSDTAADYHAEQPFPASEVVPALSAGGGRLSASADQKYFALFDRALAPSSSDAVVIIDPAQFVGTNHNEDTFFLGLAKDADNYVTTWYNNTRTEIGADVRVAGNFPAFSKSGYGNHPVVPGDRLAEQVHGTQLVTYLEHAGTWQRIGSFDVGSLIPADQLAQYHVAVGFRADGGTLQISRFEAVSR